MAPSVGARQTEHGFHLLAGIQPSKHARGHPVWVPLASFS